MTYQLSKRMTLAVIYFAHCNGIIQQKIIVIKIIIIENNYNNIKKYYF